MTQTLPHSGLLPPLCGESMRRGTVGYLLISCHLCLRWYGHIGGTQQMSGCSWEPFCHCCMRQSNCPPSRQLRTSPRSQTVWVLLPALDDILKLPSSLHQAWEGTIGPWHSVIHWKAFQDPAWRVVCATIELEPHLPLCPAWTLFSPPHTEGPMGRSAPRWRFQTSQPREALTPKMPYSFSQQNSASKNNSRPLGNLLLVCWFKSQLK